MSHHRTYNIDLETTLELFPGIEPEPDVLIEAVVEIFTDTEYGADADGNRGFVRGEINFIALHSIRLYIPNRPTIIITKTEAETAAFLNQKEYETYMELASEMAFAGKGKEV